MKKEVQTKSTHLRMHQINKEERPREKLLAGKSKEMSDAELIAILLNTGTTQQNVLSLSTELLSAYEHSLYNVYKHLSIPQNEIIKGIGPAKRAKLLAALELGIRINKELEERRTQCKILRNSQQVYNYMRPHFMGLNQEEVWCLYFNNRHELITRQRLSAGGSTECIVDIKQILKNAVLYSAQSIILMHNHPSGSTQPSEQDNLITFKLRDAARTLDLRLDDHVIHSDYSYYSYADEGYL